MEKKLKLKIISDGITTKVIDQNTGEEIPYILSVSWSHSPNEIAKAVIVVIADCDIITDSDSFTQCIEDDYNGDKQ